ncbi:MAG: DUF3465 domain-containing protein [Pirellulales bacterium]
MKRILLALAVTAVLCVGFDRTNGPLALLDSPNVRTEAIATAFRDRKSGMQVRGEGVVVRILADDTVGRRHQRFILSLPSGQTLLIAHNIDRAPRIAALKRGDTVAFNGVYEWNSKGGVIHWTHHDPSGRHVPGWLKHGGRTYQ